jgi:hypothetical protein
MSDPKRNSLEGWARREALDAVVRALCEAAPFAWRRDIRAILLEQNVNRPEPHARAFSSALNRFLPAPARRSQRTTRCRRSLAPAAHS